MLDKEKQPIIETEGVEKKYSGTTILEDFDFKIMPGEFVILVGPSGAGKSTLVRLLIREEKPEKGSVRIAGRDITRLKQYELPFLRRNIGIVFQDYKLLPNKTVWENVAFALEVCDLPDSEISRRVPKVLQAVNLTGRENAYPNQLSGGEAQRVCIARALVHAPKIFIADEPTGNLDPAASREIADILEKINCQGTTVLLATHDKELVDQMRKRVVTMKKGQVVSDQKQGRYNSC
ncbi:MAG: Cell division ATP-binding protein FtsE [candidate division WS2 bacterium ADurb.Bin280]|uniref:Cell division ATP-binding protein FtsE n=1 Tax=candidate division WS2 bacterium ADurb.Bin280 TaxID=1852829 RepID=A0A1V5SEG9_9BACT|nr:MAG: Cell division ATP-binding protein FtsE [candidate division WS2 bacterium ADurb.Bin280]